MPEDGLCALPAKFEILQGWCTDPEGTRVSRYFFRESG